MSAVTRMFARSKAIPWLTWIALGRQVAERGHAAWVALTPAERRELQRILREAHWRPNAVSEADRDRLRRHVTKAVKAAAARRGH